MEICPRARRRDKEQSPVADQIITGLPEYLARIFLVFFLTTAVANPVFKINSLHGLLQNSLDHFITHLPGTQVLASGGNISRPDPVRNRIRD